MGYQTTRGPIFPIGPEHKREILRLLARGEREIAAGTGYDLDKVLAEAEDSRPPPRH